MNEQNPYVAPDASLAVEEDFYQPSIFSFKGRIGRLRYLAYGVGTSIVLMAVLMPIVGGTMVVAGGDGQSILVIVAMAVFYIAAIALSVMFGKRRLNDLNRAGWWLLFFIVPLLNLVLTIYLIFFPGSEGSNRFGAPPAANSMGVKILGWMLPVLFVVGILAAIAVPQYVEYVARAEQSQVQ
ncbi:MAG: DUF805 domain-containing protein [Gammaproteobacteria bacterium]